MHDTGPRRRLVFRPSLLTLALVALAVVLVAFAAWGMARHARPAPPEAPQARMMRQVKAYGGSGAELRYAETGQRRAICGYVGRRRNGPAVGFVSTPNRILFSDDPLPREYARLRQRYCPSFLIAPPTR